MSRLTPDGTAQSVSRDQILRREPGQGQTNSSCSADLEQSWQPYLVDPYSAKISDDHTSIHTDWGGRGYDDFVLGEVTKKAPSGDETT